MKSILLSLFINTFFIIPLKCDTDLNKNLVFPNLIESIKKLESNKSSEEGTVAEITSLIKTWDEYKSRIKTFELIKQELSFDSPILLIEWGGGGHLYRSIIITNKMVIYIEKKNTEKFEVKKMQIKEKYIAQIKTEIEKLFLYSGNASISGNDIQTFFFTIWKDEKIINNFAVYALDSTLNDIYFNRKPSNAKFFMDTLNAAKVLDIILKCVNVDTIGQPYRGKSGVIP